MEEVRMFFSIWKYSRQKIPAHLSTPFHCIRSVRPPAFSDFFFTLERMGTALVTTDFTTGIVMGGDSACSRSMRLRIILSCGGHVCMFSVAARAGRLFLCCMAVHEMACAEVEREPVGKTMEQNGLRGKGVKRSIEIARGCSSSA